MTKDELTKALEESQEELRLAREEVGVLEASVKAKAEALNTLASKFAQADKQLDAVERCLTGREQGVHVSPAAVQGIRRAMGAA